MKNKSPNLLINETSPYLLQHAYNPVNWHAWNDMVLDKAKTEDKPIIISIGYSACHWCHVMEKEVFEDIDVAEIMNSNFICIKVDREELPDIDMVYMNALRAMNIVGGWPLNCFALPDSKPFFGGTYFNKEQWINVLNNVLDIFKNKRKEIEIQAEKISNDIKVNSLIDVNNDKPAFIKEELYNIYNNFSKFFDFIEGGLKGIPKFPLPNNLVFLLRYYNLTKNNDVLTYINNTLTKIAYGGIFDQLEGGFSRYSVDEYWRVPHYEKMLYDNAQMVSLYCEAYQLTKNGLFKEVVYKTLNFVKNNLTSPEGGFYSSLNADSNNIEGDYYLWTKEEINDIIPEHFELICDYYNIKDEFILNNNKYILFRKKSRKDFAKKHKLSLENLNNILKESAEKLLNVRNKRIKPSTDDKILTSWNALMLKAYIDAYMVFGNDEFLNIAHNNAVFIEEKLSTYDGGLFHSFKNNQAKTIGYLDDYSFAIEAFIALYQATFDESWLETARNYLLYVIEHFYDKNSGMFYYTSDEQKTLISRKIDVIDNVIPCANSSLAKSLFLFGKIYKINTYNEMSLKMLNNVKNKVNTYCSAYSNWAILWTSIVNKFFIISITGDKIVEKQKEFGDYYIPEKIILGTKQDTSNIPHLKDRFFIEETIIYTCVDKLCKMPVTEVYIAVDQINNW